MMKIFPNIYQRIKYGKIVHRGADGTVIRKKLNYPIRHFNNKTHVDTTKTVINQFGQVERQLNRSADINNNDIHTSFDSVIYRPVDGAVHKKSKTINYIVGNDNKRIVDYNINPDADYSITKLPDGRTQYDIYYPEVTTIIKGGPVTKKADVKTCIV